MHIAERTRIGYDALLIPEGAASIPALHCRGMAKRPRCTACGARRSPQELAVGKDTPGGGPALTCIDDCAGILVIRNSAAGLAMVAAQWADSLSTMERGSLEVTRKALARIIRESRLQPGIRPAPSRGTPPE